MNFFKINRQVEEAKVKLTIPAEVDYTENRTVVSIDTPSPSEPTISVTSVAFGEYKSYFLDDRIISNRKTYPNSIESI